MHSEHFQAARFPGALRAIRIDPWARTIAEGWIRPGLQGLYAALSGPGFPVDDDFPTDPALWAELEREPVDVSCIDIRNIGKDRRGADVDLILDDEGRLRGHMACFRFGDELLVAGRALLLSNDGLGETTSSSLELHDARRPVSFAPWDTDYTPDAPKVYGMNEGEDWPAFLERVRREQLADGI